MHVYPSELVALINQRWNGVPEEEVEGSPHQQADNLPDRVALEQLISTCYQVSMMREEDRPVTLRLIVAERNNFV